MTVSSSWSRLAALLLLIPGYVSAEPLSRSEVPLPLKPWVEWVLMTLPVRSCRPGRITVNVSGPRACIRTHLGARTATQPARLAHQYWSG